MSAVYKVNENSAPGDLEDICADSKPAISTNAGTHAGINQRCPWNKALSHSWMFSMARLSSSLHVEGKVYATREDCCWA